MATTTSKTGKPTKKARKPSRPRARKPQPVRLEAAVWNCDDLKSVISKTIKAHVKDVELARRLEHALGDEIAYGDGGGGGVGVA